MTTDLTAIALSSAEWDELVFAADAAERTVDAASSIYGSVKHWIEAVLPLHERMIRERLHADLAHVQGELTEARQKVRIGEQQAKRLDAENARLRKQAATGRCADCDAIDRALEAELNDDDIDALMRTTDSAMIRQLNDVIDVPAGLSEILTRHERGRS
jgi:hypothetical protein